MSSYKEEKKIKQLAIYYVGSNFNVQYEEEFYQLVSSLAGKIARKYYKVSNTEVLDDIVHKTATEVFLRLKEGRIKPDLEAWTRYIMVRVRRYLPHFSESGVSVDCNWKSGSMNVDDSYDLSSAEDVNSCKSVAEVDYNLTFNKSIQSFCARSTKLIPFTECSLVNLILYNTVLSLFEDVNVSEVLPKRIGFLTQFLRNDLQQVLGELCV